MEESEERNLDKNTVSIPKIMGFVAEKNIMVFIYRKSRKTNYLIHFQYDKQKEKFTLGSKFFGRFYPMRCDLSADGRHFIYFVMGNYKQYQYKEFFPCWTAICNPPNIKANFFLGSYDTWFGGGRFLDNKTLFINSNEPIKQKNYMEYRIISELNDIENIKYNKNKGWEKEKVEDIIFWKKSNGKITLYKKYEYDYSYEKGEYDVYKYTVIQNSSQKEISLENCNWADFDNFGRLIASNRSKVILYKNFHEIENNKFKILCDFEKLVNKKGY